MKLAFAGKGGVGKTTLAALTSDLLARHGHDVWMVDADTALSLGQASGLAGTDLPVPLVQRQDLIRERIGVGLIDLDPDVDDLPASLSVDVPLGGPAAPGHAAGRKRLLVMGSVAAAGGGCACEANALLKAVLAHLVLQPGMHVIVDLEAGVEHLGRGTASHVDGLVVVTEPSRRSLETASEVSRLATALGINRQVLAVNRSMRRPLPDDIQGLPAAVLHFPILQGLLDRQLDTASVLGLPEGREVEGLLETMLALLGIDHPSGPASSPSRFNP
jgi:CO dehydrogenase maturation factor